MGYARVSCNIGRLFLGGVCGGIFFWGSFFGGSFLRGLLNFAFSKNVLNKKNKFY